MVSKEKCLQWPILHEKYSTPSSRYFNDPSLPRPICFPEFFFTWTLRCGKMLRSVCSDEWPCSKADRLSISSCTTVSLQIQTQPRYRFTDYFGYETQQITICYHAILAVVHKISVKREPKNTHAVVLANMERFIADRTAARSMIG